MNARKLGAAAGVIALIVGLFTGCGSTNSASNATSDGDSNSGTTATYSVDGAKDSIRIASGSENKEVSGAIEQAAKQPASEQTRAAKRRQRHGDGARVDVRDLCQEGLDIAVTRVVAGRHKNRDRVERDQERVLEQLGQLFDGKALARRHGREHRCLVDDRDG